MSRPTNHRRPSALIRTPYARRVALLAAAAMTAACGDAAGPTNKVDVSVGVDFITGPNLNQAPQDGNRVACDVNMHAVATGTGKAKWGRATFKWYAGKDRSTPMDSADAPAVDVRRAWRDSTIASGGRQETVWTVWADVPFSGAIDFHYDAGQGDRTASLSFNCGPEVPAGASPTVINNITAQSRDPYLEPGGVLVVGYTAASSIGVWRTAVLVSGPCEVYREYDERFETTLNKSVALDIPSDCEPGAPVDVTVYATDAALDRRAKQISSSYTLVDKTRPWIRGTTLPRPTGPYFTGDTIVFDVETGDNHLVKSIVWEARPFGARDSIAAPPRGESVKVRMPVPSSWSGPAELRYFARDAAGLASDTIASSAGTVAIYPTVDRPTTWMSVDDANGVITDAVVDVRRSVVYVLQPVPRRISVVSLASMKVVSTISLSLYPANIDLTAGGDSLLVALPDVGALGIVDLRRADRRLELVALDSIPGGLATYRPSHVSEVRALSNGKAYLVADIDYGNWRLLEIDLATGVQRLRFEAGYGSAVGSGGAVLARSPDATAMAIRTGDCVQRFDAALDQFGPCVRITPLGIVSSADASGQRFSIGADVYDASWRRIVRLETLPAGTGYSSVLTLDGRDVFLPYPDGIVRSSAVDGRILNRQRLPVQPSLLRLSPDGQLVIAVGTGVTTGLPAIAVLENR